MPEKKGLQTVIAFLLMVVMVVCSLFIGANKAWTKRWNEVNASRMPAEATLTLRTETAYNLLTVAGRYLPADNGAYAAVLADLSLMQDEDEWLSDRAEASCNFQEDAKKLLSVLAANAQVQNDSRDHMYVTLMLPQAVEQCANNAAFTAYDTAASSYNNSLNSFSGLLARMTGVEYAELFEVQ